MKYRRINIFAAPGAGKSTNASRVFTYLKQKHLESDTSVELVQEYVKSWAWEGREPKGYDQFYIFANQMRREVSFLDNGGDILVNDSPLMLSLFYSQYYNLKLSSEIYDVVCSFEEDFPSLNLFLDRGDRVYDPNGRFQTEEESHRMDNDLYRFLQLQDFDVVRVTEKNILSVVDDLTSS